MSDPGTIIAIIQISAKVASLCKYYLETARDAPADLRAIFIRVAAFKAMFESIKFLQSNNHSNLPEDLILRCLQAIKELEALVPPRPVLPTGQKLRRGEKANQCLQALAWPLKAKKAGKLLKEIDECTSAVNLSLTVETAQTVEEIKTILSDSRRLDVCMWLVQVDPSGLHNQVCQLYEPHTAEWALATKEWKDWVYGGIRCVWVHGIPGAGKTVLASRLFKETQRICDSNSNYGCIYYYCYQRQRNDAMPFLRWILSQLCRMSDQIPGSVYQIFKSGVEPTTEQVLQGIQECLGAFDVVFVVLDAIDESADHEWEDLLAAIRGLADSRFWNLRLLATSREYEQIKRTMQEISQPISMDNPLVTEDITRWVKSKIEKDAYMSRWPINLANKVKDTLPHRARGMFRWAVCQIDCLRRLKHDGDAIESTLKCLPEKLEDIYLRIFDLIPKDERLFLRHILRLIFFNRRLFQNLPLPINIVIESFEATERDSKNKSRYYDEDILKDVCGCLVRISQKSDSDQMLPVMCASYAHYTVFEFLEGIRVDDMFKISAHLVLIESFKTALIHGTEQAGDTFEKQVEEELHWQVYASLSALKALQELSTRTLFQSDSELWDRLDLLLAKDTQLTQLYWKNKTTPGIFEYLLHIDLSDICGIKPQELAPYVACLWTCEKKQDFHLAGQYLQRFYSGHSRFQQPVTLDIITGRNEIVSQGRSHTTLNGSLPEVFALLSCSFPQSFCFLLDQSFGELNFSGLLLTHIGVDAEDPEHFRKPLKKDCSVCRHLVRKGASVNGDGFRISPLQIAVYNSNITTVKLLVKHGADVNCIGNPEGVVWEEASCLGQYNRIAGKHPLEIVWNGRYSDRSICDDIHQILVNSGAFVAGEKCRVTSLQSAAYELNVRAVERLLKLGADLDEVGSSINGLNKYERRFSFLVGKSPLQCCRHDQFGTKGKRIEDILAVERLLLSYRLDRAAARCQSVGSRSVHGLDSEEGTDDGPTESKKRKITKGDHTEV